MRRLLLIALLLLSVPVPAAYAAYPGENGKIAFQTANGIRTMNPDGSNVLALNPNQLASDPSWSPGGDRIAFNRNGSLVVANADGSSPQTVLTGIFDGPTWSPDASRLAVPMHGADTVWPQIHSANLDGTDVRQLTGLDPDTEHEGGGQFPSWSPTGERIAYGGRGLVVDEGHDVIEGYHGLLMVSTDGVPLPHPDAPYDPDRATFADWSPDGSKIAVSGPCDNPCGSGYDIWVVEANGSGTPTNLTNSVDDETHPAWSPDSTKITFASKPTPSGDFEIYVMNANGSGRVQLTNNTTGDLFPSWQPVQRPHVRPKGASPLRLSLVPAYEPCTAPNLQHGPPFALGSCTPQRGPARLSVGVGDGHPALPRSVGFVRMAVEPGAVGPPEDSDVRLTFSLTNVMHTSDRSEYLGELRSEVNVRLTDTNGVTHSTTSDFPFGFTVPCASTPSSSTIASTCSRSTSANALVPGAVKDSNRAIWELDALRVYDGGPDEDADTAAGNSLFMTQGVFVP